MFMVLLTCLCQMCIVAFMQCKTKIKMLSLSFSWAVFVQVFLMYLSNMSYMTNKAQDFIFSKNLLNIFWLFNVDNLSLVFVFLTCLLVPLCYLYVYNFNIMNYKFFVMLLGVLQLLLLNAFVTTSLVMFYIYFESVLVPMAFIMIGWGSRQRKMHAFYLFFMYTLIGSLLLLVALISIHSHLQSTDLLLLQTMELSFNRQSFMWWCFFMGFAIKIPMVPFHVWLPEAHTEAPTMGSVLLAAVLLKLGSYGMLKFLFVLLPIITKFYMPNMLLICLLGMFYISLTAMRQIDAKKVIAYSSVAHMSYVVAGALFASYLSHVGSVFLMFGHGLVSAGLFFCVGFLYERSKTSIMKYYGGIASVSPMLTFAFLFLTFANTAFPGTCNFVGELLVLLAMCEENIFLTVVATFAIVFGSVYSMWLFNSVFLGPLSVLQFIDLSKKEKYIAVFLMLLMMWFGMSPNQFLNSVYNVLLLT